MKGKAVIGIAVLILTLLSTAMGCASTKGGGAVDMMKKIPIGSDSFAFIDIDAIRTDNDLEDIYIGIADSFGMFPGSVGINFDELDRLTNDEIGNVLLEGDFYLDKIRGTFTELEYNRDEYSGVEVWGIEGGLIALVSNKLIIFSFEDTVKDYIKVINGVDASLYDDEDFRDVIERLPRGIAMVCTEGIFPVFPTSHDKYDGLKVAGFSVMKKDEYSVAYTMVSKFENSNDASDAMDEIQFNLESDELYNWRNITVKQDAEFVIVTTELDIEDMF